MTTQIALYQAQGILSDLVESQQSAALCCLCQKSLGAISYVICQSAEQNQTTSHEAHTACADCIENRDHVGEKGACKACLNDLKKECSTGTRRAAEGFFKKAGLALIPPTRNSVVNRMGAALSTACESIDKAKDEMEDARIREGAERRAAAIEAVHRKRAEAEEEMERMKEQSSAAAAADAAAVRLAAEEAAKQIKERAEADALRFYQESKAKAKEEYAKARKQAIATAAAATAHPASPQTAASPAAPKRKALSEEQRLERSMKMRKTCAEKKEKLARLAEVEAEVEALNRQLWLAKCMRDNLSSVAEEFVAELGGNVAEFRKAVAAGEAELQETIETTAAELVD